MLSLKDVGPLRNMYLRCADAMLLKNSESEEVITTNLRNISADMCIESILQAIIQDSVSFQLMRRRIFS